MKRRLITSSLLLSFALSKQGWIKGKELNLVKDEKPHYRKIEKKRKRK